MAKNVAIKIAGSNLGPLENLSYVGEKKDSNTTLIYARNGSGKTFLSRMFRLLEDGSSAKAENLITFGRHSGSFSFSVIGNEPRVGAVELEPGVAPRVQNDTDLIFHVFNSDYVRDSVEKSDFAAPSDIDGYIVGKGNVDASKEKAEVKRLENEKSDALAQIEKAVSAVRAELRKAGISANLSSFKEITPDSVLTDSLPITETYAAQLQSLKRLSEITDDDITLRLPTIEFEDDLAARVRELLATPFKREHFAQEFVDRVNSNVDFVKAGVAAFDECDGTCPFCGQPIGPDAAELIHLYEEYLNAAEAKARDELDHADRALCELKREAVRWGKDAFLAASGLREAVALYPSLSDLNLPHNPGPDGLMNAIDSLRGALFEKSRALGSSLSEEPVDAFENALAEIQTYEAQATPLFGEANKAKSNVASEKKECKNLLCGQARARLRISLDDEVKAVEKTVTELEAARQRVRALEEQSREPRKARVAEIFDRLLQNFFGGKYSFDPVTFTVSLGTHEMRSDNELVLSEGEKTILAFCIYLASTVERIDRDGDWNRLLFVIDDPISSLDHDYVYTMVGCIADIKRRLGMDEDARLRFLVLTHNYSFFNILAGSNVASNLLILERGKIREASDDEIFPFEQHLADIIRVADGEAPTHSTGNSIRHVVEWAWHIQRPDIDGLGKYIGLCDGLKSNPALYYICNDLSHGCHERAAGCFDSDLSSACGTVVDFMESEFKGQVDNVREHFVK